VPWDRVQVRFAPLAVVMAGAEEIPEETGTVEGVAIEIPVLDSVPDRGS